MTALMPFPDRVGATVEHVTLAPESEKPRSLPANEDPASLVQWRTVPPAGRSMGPGWRRAPGPVPGGKHRQNRSKSGGT